MNEEAKNRKPASGQGTSSGGSTGGADEGQSSEAGGGGSIPIGMPMGTDEFKKAKRALEEAPDDNDSCSQADECE